VLIVESGELGYERYLSKEEKKKLEDER